jgi:endonuclease/exonuclease/phosphatase family metal-dependent hydrolase
MKRFFGIVLFVVLLPLFASAQAGKDNLKVMTFNLRFGELASLEDMAAFISDEAPDLVALQECDWKTERARALRQNGKAFVNELAYHTGMFGLYGKAINYAGGYYGIGLLSRYPIIHSERILLPNPEPRKEQRAMLVADIELPDGSVITFICTHLEVSTSEQRAAQVEFINQYASRLNNPVILAGDMNATPDTAEISEGFAGWDDTTNRQLTYSTEKPEIKIDYIFTYPKGTMTGVATRVHTECMLSDHFPVSSIIKIK